MRLTFFPNGCYRSWTDNAAALRPLVDSGQVAFGNHTWSHPDLTTLRRGRSPRRSPATRSSCAPRSGSRDTPFLRPPYGARDERIDRIAADLGHPTIAMWNGTLDDSRVLTAEELLAAARQWFTAQTIVVGHANHPTVPPCTATCLALIAERGLRTVTLADVWATPAQRLRGAGRRAGGRRLARRRRRAAPSPSRLEQQPARGRRSACRGDAVRGTSTAGGR